MVVVVVVVVLLVLEVSLCVEDAVGGVNVVVVWLLVFTDDLPSRVKFCCVAGPSEHTVMFIVTEL